MTQIPSRPDRQLPADAAERSDHEVLEMLFGTDATAELERMAGVDVADVVMPPA
ncbi:MAG: hypothetical protein OXH23_10525 [bacterium]|nr:hypothetical protein [bacterium]